jgi:hypothetical protein
MKRTHEASVADVPVRDYETVLAEERAAWKQYCTLSKELSEHPETKARKEREARQKLIDSLPQALHQELVYNTRLLRFSFDMELDEGHNGDPCRIWRFSADFAGRSHENSIEEDRSHGDFDLVDFDHRPLRLWHRALDENDDGIGDALAAFCYACCEHLGDFSAMPVKAFPQAKGKNEAVV